MKNKIKLQLSDIAGYLPYGLKVQRFCEIDNHYEQLKVIGCMLDAILEPALWLECTEGRGGFMECVYLCKPILRPMSDLDKPMTHPDINDGEEFVPSEKIIELLTDVSYDDSCKKIETFTDEQCIYLLHKARMYYDDCASIISFLSKLHFDYNGLIDKGLAIDINTLKE